MSASYDYGQAGLTRELLVEVQRRVPAGQRLVQEAFTSDHGRPVQVKLSAVTADTFYLLDEITAHAFNDAVIELAAQRGGGRLTVSYPFNGEFRAQVHRLQRLARKVEKIRVLALESSRKAGQSARGLDFRRIAGTPLVEYRLALCEGQPPMLFICRDARSARASANPRGLGFFTFDADTIGDIAEDVDQALHGVGTQLAAFQRLEVLHQTTQRVVRELESYSRRMDLAIRRARRRPDLLTPSRFERIVGQAIAKMEELKDIPRRALRTIDKPGR